MLNFLARLVPKHAALFVDTLCSLPAHTACPAAAAQTCSEEKLLSVALGFSVNSVSFRIRLGTVATRYLSAALTVRPRTLQISRVL